MALYEYRCTGCGREQEMILPMSSVGAPQPCPDCGSQMERKISAPLPPIVVVDARGRMMMTLNKEKGYDFPGGSKHRNRYEKVMWEGLQQKDSQKGQYRGR